MKTFIFVALAMLVVLPIGVLGEASPPDHYITHFQPVAGVVSAAGQADWFVAYPTSVPGAGTYRMGVTASITSPVVGTITILIGPTFTTPGCTFSLWTSDNAVTAPAANGRALIVIDPGVNYCAGFATLRFQVGSTVISQITAYMALEVESIDILDDTTSDSMLSVSMPTASNPILDAFSVLAPLILFVVAVIWAEATKEFPLYILAILLGSVLVIGLWSELEGLRTMLVFAIAAVALRGHHILTTTRGD